ncbi:putative mitochondrial short-chain dehydrogenase [Leptomonas pyrrhocoris]|uniref:Putative mitochondrial short-chain dehydrogenase n=1 Tax=Leptomonas pyrrhocoris TaxID=157538 RepID=A0A0M9GAF0_LEPPY|nr:putative mitochondrial short-chain dehydrogenase [Leptomonas pyrrhocoris]KPA86173.1 putative mitochondrial short-chain dehydrogenase [Leptomonas pyrrhocoris]|eukprot:XP_015664612.1 putative mitochondrial short-chain dehydrogenase [Leptomonas pyrrhocoris]
MRFCYKSETGAAVLSICALVSCFLVPKRYIPVVIPLWAAAGRFVARGAINHARPVNDADPAERQAKARFVMSRDMPLEKRPVAIVTGTNSGIGYWTAVGLAAEGYEVIVTCRSAALSVETAEKVRAEAEKERRAHPQKYAHSPEKVLVQAKMPVECDNFDSVRAFVAWVLMAYASRNVQVLVNNAGVMRTDIAFSSFHPNLELHTAVNFLGPLLLTELLLPLLEKNGGRVVYVSSEAHRFPQGLLDTDRFGTWKSVNSYPTCTGLAGGKLLMALLQLNQSAEKSSGPFHTTTFGVSLCRYGASKLLNSYHAHVIARRYAVGGSKSGALGVNACSLHPGCVATRISRSILGSFVSAVFAWGSLLFLKTCWEGAQTTLHCAMCPHEELELVDPSGAKATASPDAVSPYFVECADKTCGMLLAYGWDLKEAETIVDWGKQQVGLL